MSSQPTVTTIQPLNPDSPRHPRLVEHLNSLTGARHNPNPHSRELPITPHIPDIVEAVTNNPAVIVKGETGSGKTTEIPKALLDAGFEVIVTQPRVLAAISEAEFVAELHSIELGGEIGYRTGKGSMAGQDTKLTYCTDGLVLVKEILGNSNKPRVIMIDEIHEWNANMDVLLGWLKQKVKEGLPIKIVCCSATMDIDGLSKYLGNLPGLTGKAPVFDIPGRLYPITDLENQYSNYKPVDACIFNSRDLANNGEKVLTILPGKREIEDARKQLEDQGFEVRVLHAELPTHEQKKVLENPIGPCIVLATPVVETSITIPWVTAVVDSGLQRLSIVENGVEGLHTVPISKDQVIQRKGRAGRCQAGKYIYCGKVPLSELEDHLIPEIQRKRLDQEVLRLLEIGIDLENLDLYHAPPKDKVYAAKASLKLLGCVDKDLNVTELGHKVARLPVSVQLGRMLVEAEKLGVLDEAIPLAALLEQGGVGRKKERLEHSPLWRMHVGDESESDIFAQLKLLNLSKVMDRHNLWDKGIHPKAIVKVRDTEKSIRRALHIPDSGNTELTEETRLKLRKCICAGMLEHTYLLRGGFALTVNDQFRKLSHDSVVLAQRENQLIVAKPFDVPYRTRYGEDTLSLVQMATLVEPEWILEFAKHLAEYGPVERIEYNNETNQFRGLRSLKLAGHELEPDVINDSTHPAYQKLLRAWVENSVTEYNIPEAREGEPPVLAVLRENREQQRISYNINHITGEQRQKVYPSYEYAALVRGMLDGITSLFEIKDPEKLRLPRIDSEELNRYEKEYPSSIILGRCTALVEYHRSYSYLHDGRYLEVTIKLTPEHISADVIQALRNEERSRLLVNGRTARVAMGNESFTASTYGELLDGILNREVAAKWLAWKPPQVQYGTISDYVPTSELRERAEEALRANPNLGEVPRAAYEDLLPQVPPVRVEEVGQLSDGTSIMAYGSLVMEPTWAKDYSENLDLNFRWHRTKGEAEAAQIMVKHRLDIIAMKPIIEVEGEVSRAKAREQARKVEALRDELVASGKAFKSLTAISQGRGESTLNKTWVIGSKGHIVPGNAVFGGDLARPSATQEKWDYISPGNIVIRFSRNNISEKGRVEVLLSPEDGPTDAQLDMIAHLEKSVGLPRGALGLSRQALEGAKVINFLSKELNQCPVTRKPIDWNDTAYKALISRDGLVISSTKDPGNKYSASIVSLANFNGMGEKLEDGLKAQEIDFIETEAGVVHVYVVIHPDYQCDIRVKLQKPA